ncbi:MAG: RNA polymerase sigma factor [Anaerolineales bacterium]|nr:RNA polymerase sigma factor [Anaerolineales bacterium]
MSQAHLTARTDEELVSLCLARGNRDERPFQELFQRHRQMVWHVCYSYTRHPQDAEDLTQDVFFKVYRHLSGFEGRAAFKTWLYRIAVNTAQNELRRRGRRPQEAGTAVDDLAEVLPSPANVETSLQAQSEQRLLLAAMSHLRPQEQAILQMKDVDQLPYADIAANLDIGLSAAKMRVQRARLALQAAYQALAGDPLDGQ